jgi:hypothetical protein
LSSKRSKFASIRAFLQFNSKVSTPVQENLYPGRPLNISSTTYTKRYQRKKLSEGPAFYFAGRRPAISLGLHAVEAFSAFMWGAEAVDSFQKRSVGSNQPAAILLMAENAVE